jgi:hypothetical protein
LTLGALAVGGVLFVTTVDETVLVSAAYEVVANKINNIVINHFIN